MSDLDVSSSSEETEDFSKDFNARYQRMKYIRKLNKFISRHDLVIHGIVKNKNYCKFRLRDRSDNSKKYKLIYKCSSSCCEKVYFKYPEYDTLPFGFALLEITDKCDIRELHFTRD